MVLKHKFHLIERHITFTFKVRVICFTDDSLVQQSAFITAYFIDSTFSAVDTKYSYIALESFRFKRMITILDISR